MNGSQANAAAGNLPSSKLWPNFSNQFFAPFLGRGRKKISSRTFNPYKAGEKGLAVIFAGKSLTVGAEGLVGRGEGVAQRTLRGLLVLVISWFIIRVEQRLEGFIYLSGAVGSIWPGGPRHRGNLVTPSL